MKIVILNEAQTDFFAALDPLGVMDKGDMSNAFFLGAVTTEDKKDIPAGLAVCTMDEDAVSLRWIYVSHSYRAKGYGDELLNAVFRAAGNGAKRYVRAFIPNAYGKDYICGGAEDFLRLNGFTKDLVYDTDETKVYVAEVTGAEEAAELPQDTEGVDGLSILDITADISKDQFPERDLTDEDLVLSLSDIAGSVLGNGDKGENAIALGKLTIPVLGRGLNRLLKKHPYDVYADGDLLCISPECYDEELSSAYVENGEIVGVFLLHPDKNGIIWADYLFDGSLNPGPRLLAMLNRTAKVFVSKYPKKTEVAIRMKRPETRQLLKKIFPDKTAGIDQKKRGQKHE